MNREKIFSVVKNLFIDIFKDQDLIITETTNTDEVENWDSLNHVILISALEEELNIKFPLGEIADLTCVGDILDSCLEKIEESK